VVRTTRGKEEKGEGKSRPGRLSHLDPDLRIEEEGGVLKMPMLSPTGSVHIKKEREESSSGNRSFLTLP